MYLPALVYFAALWAIRPVSGSYGYMQPQQPQNYYTTAKPYYAPPSVYYTTAKPYYTTPAAYYTTPAPYYTTPAPYYTTAKPYYTTAAPYYTTTKAYYTTPAAYYTTAAPYYTTPKPYYSEAPVYTTSKPYVQPSYTTQPTYYQQPSYTTGYTTPSYYPENYEGDDNGWYNYAFKFNVNDYYGNEQSRSETHENQQTRGKYTVNLPDGRKQIVTYEADHNGYRADVSYEPAENSYSDNSNYYSTSKYESDSYQQQTAPAQKSIWK